LLPLPLITHVILLLLSAFSPFRCCCRAAGLHYFITPPLPLSLIADATFRLAIDMREMPPLMLPPRR